MLKLLLTGTLLLAVNLQAQIVRRNDFLPEGFPDQKASLIRSPEFPHLSLQFANEPVHAVQGPGKGAAILRASGSQAVMIAHLEHDGIFDLCRVRHRRGSGVPFEELKLIWQFPMDFNESMTLDASALEGHPLYLPDGTIPAAHHLNWGTLFYDRAKNLVVGTTLSGAEPASSNWGRRTGRTGPTELHIWTAMGRPDLEFAIFAYRPRDSRLWWSEWYQEQARRAPADYAGMFPILSPYEASWAPGEEQRLDIVPGPAEKGGMQDFVLIDDVREREIARKRFKYELPVTHLNFHVGNWRSGLYRAVVLPAGAPVQASVRQFSKKLLTLILRPATPAGTVLFVAPTDMWRAYASNGGHAMTSWRQDDKYDSVGYSPTVLNTRFRRTNHYYYGLYERFRDIQHYGFLRELSQKDGFTIDYCTQDDIALDRVHLSDYRLVLIGSHAEFTTQDTYFRFRDYMGRGGAVMIHGGDSFAVMVEYLPSLQDRRYIWQSGHFWCLLGDQPDSFMPPQILPANASRTTPISAPSAGDALDYWNLFHVTVGQWPEGSPVLVSNTEHPVMRGLGLKLGDVLPGAWAGETDIAYEPAAWSILLRSEAATADDMSEGLRRVTQPPYHHPALMIHRNLRLAEVSGEGFTNVLSDPQGELFRTLYARTLHFLLDSAIPLRNGEHVQTSGQGSEIDFRSDSPVALLAIQYTLPEFVTYTDPLWFQKPAPYAHYLVEGSADGQSWSVLADRTHGPWRGVQTDFLQGVKVRKIRLRGTFSNGEPFQATNITVFRDPPGKTVESGH